MPCWHWWRTTDGASVLKSADLPVAVAVVACWLLIPLQLGWVSSLSHAWGFNLWQYQSPVGTWLSCAALLTVSFARTRSAMLAGIDRVGRRIVASLGRRGTFGSGKVSLPLLLLVVVAVLWLLRERNFYGDSTILVYSSISGAQFVFPEIGATFLLAAAMKIARGLNVATIGIYQLWMCVCGAVTLGCLLGLGRSLGLRGSLFAVLVLCGGVSRIFAGHVEVYGLVVAAAAAYLWAAVAYLRGECRYALPAFLFGVGLWFHLSFAFLAPSLAILPLLVKPRPNVRAYSKHALIALLAGFAPMAVFVALMLAVGNTADLSAAWGSVVSTLGLSTATDAGSRELWVRGIGQTPGAGTRYAMLGIGHLKYLANSFFLMAPAAIPTLLWLLGSPKRFFATPQAVFLSVAALSTLLYSLVLRPIWGPYDWDLFSLTAVCSMALAAYLLLREFDSPAHLCLVLVVGSLLLATIPLLLAGLGTPRDAGPFSDEGIHTIGDETTEQAFDRQIGPWL